jgi:hypothetical protein
MNPSLALDSLGNPNITYYDATNKHLKYAYWNGSTWIAATLDTATQVGLYSSLALSSQNYPYITYSDDQNGNLKFAYWSGTPGPSCL